MLARLRFNHPQTFVIALSGFDAPPGTPDGSTAPGESRRTLTGACQAAAGGYRQDGGLGLRWLRYFHQAPSNGENGGRL